MSRASRGKSSGKTRRPPDAGITFLLQSHLSNLMPADDEISDEEQEAKGSTSVIEGDDYYFEGGLMVFTERFLLRRGFCCESGCRHCPYGFKKEK